MKTKLTVEQALKQPHYQNILMLIGDAQIRKKKITFDILKSILVPSINVDLIDSKVKELDAFFKYEKPEIWSGENNKPREVYSIVEFMVSISHTLNINQCISSPSNLSNFLKKLIGFGLIKRTKIGKRKPFYRMKDKGILYQIKYAINLDIEIFSDRVFNGKYSDMEKVSMLFSFQVDMRKSIGKIISSR